MRRLFGNLFFCCRPQRYEEEEELSYNIIMKKANTNPDDKKNSLEPIIQNIKMEIEMPASENGQETNSQSEHHPHQAQTLLIEVPEDADLNKPLFEDRLIRDDERPYITFTKQGLMNFVEQISNDTRFELSYNKNHLKFYCNKSGSVLNKAIYVTKNIYTVEKTAFHKNGEILDIKYIVRLMYNPEDRIKWDTSLKQLKKLEGNEECYVVRSWGVKPMPMVSEREVIDKRTEFFYNGVYYNFSTSVYDEYIPSEPDVVRVKTYFHIVTISSDDENYYFTTFCQMDLKMAVAQPLIVLTLPMQMVDWYNAFIKAVNNS